MVSCKQCTTQNSLDSAFCKKCGATLDANDIAAANDKLTSMIADGNRLFADGRTEDALMVADTAIASNPTSAAAISLKGMCLERKGMLAEALECFEQVVELQPDSTLDKLKVNDLKNMLAVEKFTVAKAPDRKVALVGAVAATVLVVTCGALFAKANASAKESGTPKMVAMREPTDDSRTFNELFPKEGTVQQNQADPQQQQQSTPQSQPNPNVQQNGSTDGGSNEYRGSGNGRSNLTIPRGNVLPNPSEEGSGAGYGPITIHPDAVPKGGVNSTTNPNSNPGGGTQTKGVDEDPEDLREKGNPGTTTEPPKNANAPGIIEIEVSKGNGNQGNNRGGGEANPNTGNGRTALIATARSQMMSGNYPGAANTFERALRAGADQASTNQRLGQCYAQMGRNGDAVAAYTRAANAFEKSGNAQGAEACRQAIKVLGG